MTPFLGYAFYAWQSMHERSRLVDVHPLVKAEDCLSRRRLGSFCTTMTLFTSADSATSCSNSVRSFSYSVMSASVFVRGLDALCLFITSRGACCYCFRCVYYDVSLRSIGQVAVATFDVLMKQSTAQHQLDMLRGKNLFSEAVVTLAVAGGTLKAT